MPTYFDVGGAVDHCFCLHVHLYCVQTFVISLSYYFFFNMRLKCGSSPAFTLSAGHRAWGKGHWKNFRGGPAPQPQAVIVAFLSEASAFERPRCKFYARLVFPAYLMSDCSGVNVESHAHSGVEVRDMD